MEKIAGKGRRVQIILREPQKQFLDEAAAAEGLSVSALIRRIVAAYQRDFQERQLEQAARDLTIVYEQDDEQTAFTTLDGEDFT